MQDLISQFFFPAYSVSFISSLFSFAFYSFGSIIQSLFKYYKIVDLKNRIYIYMQQVQVQYLNYKLGTICQHKSSKTTSNYIDIACTRRQDTYHRVSQVSKICNKCASLIMNSANSTQQCPCCSNKLQQSLVSSWFCNHKNRNLEEITIKCTNNLKETHDVPFDQKVCKSCYDKIRAAFMFSQSCPVCDEKQGQIFQNIEKTITQPSYYFFNEIIKSLKSKKLTEDEVKQQIQYFCLAQPHNQEYKSKMGAHSQTFGENLLQEHQSKRYQLYPKCSKHRTKFINLCNNCLVSVLNLNCCPYGCPYQKKQAKSVAKTDNLFETETGFICFYPKHTKDSQYLQYFSIRYTQQANKFDKWEASLKKIKYTGSQNLQTKFPLYGNCIQVSDLSFLFCGGALGNKISQMKTCKTSFLINIEKNHKNFNIENLPDMNDNRSAHSIVYLNDYVYVIGGFLKKQTKCLSSCEKFSLKNKKWQKISPLSIERSSPSALEYKGKIYVFGGVSSNPEIWNSDCQSYNVEKNSWEKIKYKGFDIPFVTGSMPLSKCWGIGALQNTYMIGGSNYEMATYFFQDLELKENYYRMNSLGSEERLDYSRSMATASLMSTDSENQKIVLIFGGVQQHQSFLSLDAVRIKINSKRQVHPFFSYDNVNVGSYRKILRENALNSYTYMKQKLIEQGILTKNKIEGGENDDKLMQSEQKLHKIEKMWYGVGKCILGFNQIGTK